jgi:hypothetical protein
MLRVRLLLLLFLVIPLVPLAQLRNGWRSVYDKEGRLYSMKYYNNGIDVPDSTIYFQYFTENVLRGIIKGEIVRVLVVRMGGYCSSMNWAKSTVTLFEAGDKWFIAFNKANILFSSRYGPTSLHHERYSGKERGSPFPTNR